MVFDCLKQNKDDCYLSRSGQGQCGISDTSESEPIGN